MGTLGQTINPNMNTDLRSAKAQGANVGDFAYGYDNIKYRWNGENWEREPRHMQDRVQIPESPEEVMARIQAETQKQMDELAARSKEFDEAHPFSFDELLAKAAVEQRYNPFYESQLKDFMAGINRQRESIGQETELIKNLNTMAQGEEARNLGEAIRASAEGAAQSGLFFSGARQRETGLKEIAAAEQATRREKQTGFNLGELGRQYGQTQTTEESTRRKLTADKATEIQTEIEKQKAEEQARRAYEKGQYLGRFATSPQAKSYMDQLLGYTYTA